MGKNYKHIEMSLYSSTKVEPHSISCGLVGYRIIMYKLCLCHATEFLTQFRSVSNF